MKTTLIVTYYFPPAADVGGLRPVKFAKYLPEFGWNPHVLTLKEKYYDMLDHSRMSEVILSQQVSRAGVWPDPVMLYGRLKEWVYCFTGRRHVYEEKVKTYHGSDHADAEGILDRVRRLLLSLLAVGGGRLGWLPPAILKALLLMRRYKINCLYTTSPRHTAHLVGLAIKKLHGVRWVADFRDPWTQNPMGRGWPSSRIADRIEAWMEKQVVKHADKVISVTERMSQAFIKKYSEIESTKFMTIPNGYDPGDFSDFPRKPRNGKFTISYVGTFYMGRTPSYFLNAVRQLIAEGKLSYDDLEIRFIGDCRYINGTPVERMLQSDGLSSVTRITDPLPYRDALRAMVASDLLLLFAPAQDDQVPAKTFEYLASGADIIAFTSSQGATADLIRATGLGVIVEPASIQQIKDSLEASYRNYKMATSNAADLSLRHSALFRYHRRTLTRELACVLE